MLTQNILADSKTRLKNLQPQDIKNLVQQKGKLKEGKNILTLHEPSPSDPRLHAVINDRTCEIRPISTHFDEHEMYYDLTAHGRTVRVKVGCRHTK